MEEEEFKVNGDLKAFYKDVELWDALQKEQKRSGQGIARGYDKLPPDESIKRRKEMVIEDVAKANKFTLAREYQWVEDAINKIGLRDSEVLTTISAFEFEFDSLKEKMWLSKINHCLALEKAKFHGRLEDQKESIDAKFTEEQEQITAKMVAHKLLEGDDHRISLQFGGPTDPQKIISILNETGAFIQSQMPFKNMGIFIPQGTTKKG